MAKWMAAAAAIVVLAGALAAQQPTAVPEVYLFQNPKPAPNLEVTTLDGKHVSLAALRGKVVLLNFWATWCGPCREEIPEFEQLQREYGGKLQVVGMSVDELPAAVVERTAVKMGINYPVAMASTAVQQRFGGMPTIPVTWVIDSRGQVQQKNHGANPKIVFDTEVRTLLGLPTQIKVARIDQLSPNGKVGTINIPGIGSELRQLTPAQRQKALAALNDQACTCGCEQSLASCRVTDPNCGFSLPQAKALIQALKAGKTRSATGSNR
ncbi:MAG: TlpA family protein disulfide reductase [Terriglobales bacterium]